MAVVSRHGRDRTIYKKSFFILLNVKLLYKDEHDFLFYKDFQILFKYFFFNI